MLLLTTATQQVTVAATIAFRQLTGVSSVCDVCAWQLCHTNETLLNQKKLAVSPFPASLFIIQTPSQSPTRATPSARHHQHLRSAQPPKKLPSPNTARQHGHSGCHLSQSAQHARFGLRWQAHRGQVLLSRVVRAPRLLSAVVSRWQLRRLPVHSVVAACDEGTQHLPPVLLLFLQGHSQQPGQL